MSIRKPFGLMLVVGVLAMAFASLPALASAAPSLKAGGVNLAKGSKIIGTSSDLKTETESGPLTCSSVTLNGEVTENPGAKVGNGTGSASGCLVGGAAAATVTSIKFSLVFVAGGSVTGTVTFEVDFPGPLTCHFEGSLKGSWTNGSSVVTINPTSLTGKKISGSGTCPTSGTLTGTAKLETTSGTAVTVNT
jgi:hypothetical protein